MKFGGPFSTEQVENVKTLIQISTILLAIGPVFVLNISSELFGLPLIGTCIAHKGMIFVISSLFLLLVAIYVCFQSVSTKKTLPL